MKLDILAVVDVAHRNGAIVKVILETALLDDQQKVIACTLAKVAGADFVKTSTGFAASGATEADVRLMRSIVGPNVGVKASGGIRTSKTRAGWWRRAPTASARAPASRSSRPARVDSWPSPAKSDLRFQERAELLDFLLEVSAVTSETLDLDKLLPAVADFISASHHPRRLRDPALQRSASRG